MNLTMKYLIWTVLTAISLTASAHGEDKLGPNGGYIRMPGAYHTEIVPEGGNKLKVFFLDTSWKTQALNNSSVAISYKGKKIFNANCEPKENAFILCAFPKEADLSKKGQLVVTSQHENQKGAEVIYKLPLKLQIVDDGHGSHH